MSERRSEDAGPEPAALPAAAPGRAAAVERFSRFGSQVVPGAPQQRRSRLQRQLEVTEGCAAGGSPREAPERVSLTPAMRKKYLKELLLSGLSNVLSPPRSVSSEQDAGAWALDPMEHAWMLSSVEGNYDTILEFISEDPYLLTRRDFISGYSVLHWLAKRGQDDTLLRLLRHAESAGIPVCVDARGSGGLTPLHVASMHARYSVVKLLVGAFSADVDAMDYNGKRAWQYLEGDAPLEMRELLGTWDEEHNRGSAHSGKQNVNNNSAGEMNVTARDEVDHVEVEGSLDRTKRGGSWRFGFIRKMLPSFSFLGNKS